MNWPQYRLDDLGYLSRGRSRHRPRNDPRLYGGEYPFIQTGDVTHANFYITNHSQTYNEEGLAQSRLWPKDTLCITIAANIAETAILSYDACFPDSIIGFVAHSNKCDVRYIKFYFDLVQAQYKQVAQGAAQDNLSQEKLLSFLISLPPIESQKKIASILTVYNELIENNNQRIALLEESMRLLYREWFVLLRFPGHEQVKVVDGVPEGWEKRTLGDIITLNYGKALKEDTRISGDVPVYGSSGIVGHHNEALIEGSAIIVGRKGNVGSVYWSANACFPIDTVYYVDREQTTPYIFMNLQHQHFVSSDVAIPGLNRSHAYAQPILIPKNNILGEFNEIAGVILRQIEILKNSSGKLFEARDLLLPRLMSGEISV